MTEEEVFEHLLLQLAFSKTEQAIIGADDIVLWPKEMLEALIHAKFLEPMSPSDNLNCNLCEMNCRNVPVESIPPTTKLPRRSVLVCEFLDIPLIDVPQERLRRWQITHTQLAIRLASLLDFEKAPQKISEGWSLGYLKDDPKGQVVLTLDTEINAFWLCVAGERLPLHHIVSIKEQQLSINKTLLVTLFESVTAEPAEGVGSPAWRTERATNAAIQRHSQPGGSHDKQKQVLALWLSRKFKSKNQCAKYADEHLGISFDAARKVLRNVQNP